MRITNLRDSQHLWNLELKPTVDEPVALGLDAKLAQDLCMQHVQGLSKITRKLPACEQTQRMAALLQDLSHELLEFFGGKILEMRSVKDAVGEYAQSLSLKLGDSKWQDGNLTSLLNNLEKTLAGKYGMTAPALRAAFIQTHSLTPYQWYRDHSRG